jgi:hypothetical protein
MKKNIKKLSSFKPRIVHHTCSVCSLRSKNVYRSIRYKKYLCNDCLVETIINDT